MPAFSNLLTSSRLKLQGQANKVGKEGGYGSIWQTVKAIMDWILTKLEAEKDQTVKHPTDYPEYYKACVQSAWAKLNDYYIKTDATYVYRMAIALHPSYRMEYFNNCWWRKKGWIDDCKDALQEAYNEYAAARVTTEQPDDTTSNSEDEFEQFGKVSTGSRRAKKLCLETEWERWTNSAVPKQDKHIRNPIHWWWDRRFEYPLLYRIAMDIFSIPAMSSECERVFSQLRRLITFERTRLGDDTIESDECQKHWLASGCLALKDSDEEDDSGPSEDVEQSDSEPAEFCI